MAEYKNVPVLFFFLSLLVSVTGCQLEQESELPVLGKVSREFSFSNQDGELVSQETFTGKLFITDFFFTTCPSICPVMKRQMHRVYEEFKGNPDVLLFSHTIDPEHDTVEILNNFAKGLNIQTEKWQLVTGDQDEIFAMAKHYMLGAMKNEEVPGGYIHSGSFVLVDKTKQIRGYYNGTDAGEVDKLINDMQKLLKKGG